MMKLPTAIWNGTRIDALTGERFVVHATMPYQPYTHMLRVAVAPVGAPAKDAEIRLVSRCVGTHRWQSHDLAPSLFDGSCHPSLGPAEHEYILLARSILRELPPGFAFSIDLVPEKDSEFNVALVAGVILHRQHPQNDLTDVPDQSYLNRIPGYRAMEELALTFALTMGPEIAEEDDSLSGEFSITIGLDELTLSFEDDEGRCLRLSSRLEEGSWHHETMFTVPSDIVEEGEIEAGRAKDCFWSIYSDTCFLPAFGTDPDLIEIQAVEPLDATMGVAFRIGPASIRGSA